MPCLEKGNREKNHEPYGGGKIHGRREWQLLLVTGSKDVDHFPPFSPPMQSHQYIDAWLLIIKHTDNDRFRQALLLVLLLLW